VEIFSNNNLQKKGSVVENYALQFLLPHCSWHVSATDVAVGALHCSGFVSWTFLG